MLARNALRKMRGSRQVVCDCYGRDKPLAKNTREFHEVRGHSHGKLSGLSFALLKVYNNEALVEVPKKSLSRIKAVT